MRRPGRHREHDRYREVRATGAMWSTGGVTRLFSPQYPREQFKKFIPPLTFLKCNSCGTTHSRQFREGDYVFEDLEEKCPSCGAEKMTIISIHVEEKPRQPT